MWPEKKSIDGMYEATQIQANRNAQQKAQAGRVISEAMFTSEKVTSGAETAIIELEAKVVGIAGVS